MEMDNTQSTEDANSDKSTPNGSMKIPLPTVLLSPTDESDDAQSKLQFKAGSKLSLPSNLGTPTSPLRLSSPMSLPTSPTPFMKISAPPPQSPKLVRSQPSSQRTAAPVLRDTPSSLTNSGSATGNPRNKCALQPRHSLMDWIRLGNSGKDLTGVGGRQRPVSTAELATHNTKDDSWLAIRGRVYNITHYIPFHPGGVEELMRGAGIDATQLFDKVHPWVNYDSLLAKCVVGPLSNDAPDAEELFGNTPSKSDRLREPSKAQELVRKSMENLANCITPVKKKITKNEDNAKGNLSKIMQSLIQSSDLPVSISRRAGSSPSKSSDESPPPLRFDWIQTSAKLTVSVYTGPLANPGGCARLAEGILLIEIATDDWLRTFKLIPEAELQEPLQLRVFAESGKVEVTALKSEPLIWKTCGEATCSAATRVTSARTLQCVVRAVSQVSHDTSLVVLAPQAGPVAVPLGHHVRVHCRINGNECVRSYTPVGDGWGSPDLTALKLAIKRYPEGTLSPVVTSLKVDDVITLSGSYGSFSLQTLKNVKTIFFIAAGTGITPMLGLLKFMLQRSNPRCEKIQLLFFNKREEDILFRSFFTDIAREDNRLTTTYVLSNAEASWKGPTGRITSTLLSDVIGKDLECQEECTHFACLCGPSEFTTTASELLKKLGMNESCVHAFKG